MSIIYSVGAQTNRNEFNAPRRYRLETQAVFSYFFINFAKLLDNRELKGYNGYDN